MRRAVVVLATLALCACALAPSGIFARVQVECGGKALIYSNAEKIDEKVTVRATDQCTGGDSEVQLIDVDGKVVQRFRIPDGGTETIRVMVPSGDWLNFDCHGNQGGCFYSIVSR